MSDIANYGINYRYRDNQIAETIQNEQQYINLNNQYYIPTKQLLSEYFFNDNNIDLKTQKQLIRDLFSGKLTLKQLRDYGSVNSNVSKNKPKVLSKNSNEAVKKYSKSKNNDGLLNDLNDHDKALRNARDLNVTKKGISIFDFDDTLATSKSKVIVEMADGSTNELTPAQFAKQHGKLEQQGASFDFSQFNKVIDGKPGPLVAKLKKASGAHAGQAKDLQKALDEGINPYVSMYRDKKGKMVYDILYFLGGVAAYFGFVFMIIAWTWIVLK